MTDDPGGTSTDRVACIGPVAPFKTQLLKWVGSKQKFAHEIIAHLPRDFGAYHEPFLGAGGVMAVLAPARGFGSDTYPPLMEIWTTLSREPDVLKTWYQDRWTAFQNGDRVAVYEAIKARFNAAPNGADFLFLCRSCYGGVVRFRRSNGHMSTPCGAHPAIPPKAFAKRVDLWHQRLRGAQFDLLDYRDAMDRAAPGDVIYCDPPYSFSQSILYGAQSFQLPDLFEAIAKAKARGVWVALSIDGTKKSGGTYCDLPLPEGLFEREIMLNVGRSMLRRFQMGGQTMEAEEVRDRLLLTY
ncbi:MAG: hypothetical protein RI979_1306 [Pseudomonadota bacterium]